MAYHEKVAKGNKDIPVNIADFKSFYSYGRELDDKLEDLHRKGKIYLSTIPKPKRKNKDYKAALMVDNRMVHEVIFPKTEEEKLADQEKRNKAEEDRKTEESKQEKSNKAKDTKFVEGKLREYYKKFMNDDLNIPVSIEKFTKYVDVGDINYALAKLDALNVIYLVLGGIKPWSPYNVKVGDRYFHSIKLKSKEGIKPEVIDPKLKSEVQKNIIDFAKLVKSTNVMGQEIDPKVTILDFKKKYGYSNNINKILLELRREGLISFIPSKSAPAESEEDFQNGIGDKFGSYFQFYIHRNSFPKFSGNKNPKESLTPKSKESDSSPENKKVKQSSKNDIRKRARGYSKEDVLDYLKAFHSLVSPEKNLKTPIRISEFKEENGFGKDIDKAIVELEKEEKIDLVPLLVGYPTQKDKDNAVIVEGTPTHLIYLVKGK